MDKEIEDILKNLYYNINSSACYSGVERLLSEARKQNPNLGRDVVEEFLTKQRTYTLYRDVKRKGPKLKTIPCFLNTDWQADLAILNRLAKENDGNVYLLVCIDVLSRMIYVEPVKTKSPKHVINAFDRIFERTNLIPWRIATDKGTEFVSRPMKEYWKSKNIQNITPENPILHATMAERAIRTIKDRLYKMISETNNIRWVDRIQKLVNAINHSINKTTGMRPSDVNYDNAKELYDRLYGRYLHNQVIKKTKFKVGDTVRIEKHKVMFTKGDTKFTDEIFRIDQVYPKRIPIVYRLKDLKGEVISGIFYQNELCQASEDTSWRIEILDERVRKGRKEYHVHWIGYPREQDSWIAASDIV